MNNSVIEITLKSGKTSRYVMQGNKHDFLTGSKFVFGKDLYSNNIIAIRTSEIAKYEIIRK